LNPELLVAYILKKTMNYTARVVWERKSSEPFIDNKYSRKHQWIFDGGAELSASSSPHVVPLPMSDASAVDPEEAFIASLSSCHMLFFLSFAAAKGFLVDRYEDNATGILDKNQDGKMAMVSVTLNPLIRFSGEKQPTEIEIDQIHHLSHERCYIANSVHTQIRIKQNIGDQST
jgi:organic hydroperoxide reductase OsmC/OhrA